MDVEHRQGTWTQLKLFEAETVNVSHGVSGDGGTEAAASEEEQATTALNRERALTSKLMERVGERENLNRAYKRRGTICDFLHSLGVPKWSARKLAGAGCGWWRMSGCPQAHQAMDKAWFKTLGFVGLSERYAVLNL